MKRAAGEIFYTIKFSGGGARRESKSLIPGQIVEVHKLAKYSTLIYETNSREVAPPFKIRFLKRVD
jgi:hypothetical protein